MREKMPLAKTMEEIPPRFTAALRVYARIGCLSFGGPAGQIALMHRELVDERGWLTERQYLNALSFCMLLPGPEAMQIATYAGWRLHGILGGLAAGLLFVLPGAAVILALAAIYVLYGDTGVMIDLFLGVKAAVVLIVVEALLRVGKRALKGPAQWATALVSFVGIFFFAVPYPVIVVIAGLYGFFSARPQKTEQKSVELPSTAAAVTHALVWLAIWLLPLGVLWLVVPNSILVDIGVFFSKLAVVTFGGAYAVLAYMGQDVVTQYGWLSAGEMMDGLGLAETTPGPLILVTEFVGFLAANKEGGLWLGLAGAGVALWVTFAPCFLWIFVGGPYIDMIAGQPRLKGALDSIVAAVVGVILNLSLWFALHVFFARIDRVDWNGAQIWAPDFATVSWLALALSGLSGFLLFRLHWGVAKTLAVVAVIPAALGVLLPE